MEEIGNSHINEHSHASPKTQHSWGSGGSSSTALPKLELKCGHKKLSPLRTVIRGANKGERFYGCSEWSSQNCDFFVWERDGVKVAMKQKEEEISGLEKKNGELLAEVKRLKEENNKLEKKVEKLKLKNQKIGSDFVKASKEEKNATMGLVLSCCCIAIVLAILISKM